MSNNNQPLLLNDLYILVKSFPYSSLTAPKIFKNLSRWENRKWILMLIWTFNLLNFYSLTRWTITNEQWIKWILSVNRWTMTFLSWWVFPLVYHWQLWDFQEIYYPDGETWHGFWCSYEHSSFYWTCSLRRGLFLTKCCRKYILLLKNYHLSAYENC